MFSPTNFFTSLPTNLPTLLLITICLYDCQCLNLSACQSIHLSVSQSIHLNANQSIQLPAYQFINLLVYKSTDIPAQLADIKKKASLSNVFCKNNKKLKSIQLKAMEKRSRYVRVCRGLGISCNIDLLHSPYTQSTKDSVSVVLSNSSILLIHSLHRAQYQLYCRTPPFSLHTVYIELSISCIVELLHSPYTQST